MLPTYGVLVAAGVIASLLVLLRIARFLLLDTDKVWNLAMLAIVMTIAGARLLPVLVNWREYGAAALAINFNGDPVALLGGIAMAAGACFFYARHAGLPIRRSADALAPSLALTSSIVSIGCLEAGCGYGTPTNAPWAIVFTSPYAAQELLWESRSIPRRSTRAWPSLRSSPCCSGFSTVPITTEKSWGRGCFWQASPTSSSLFCGATAEAPGFWEDCLRLAKRLPWRWSS